MAFNLHAARHVVSFRSARLLLLCLPLTGCIADIPLDPDKDGRTPRYLPGEVLVYEDGYRLQVTGVDGWRVSLTDNKGTKWTRSRNPVLPILAAKWNGGRMSARLDLGDKDFLWPPKRGDSATLTARLDHTPSGTSVTETWNCQVQGGEYVTVPAGRFRAIRYHCKIDGQATKSHDIHYAPDLGKIVRDSREPSGLLAVLPPYSAMSPATRRTVRAHVQSILENKPSGQMFSRRIGSVTSHVTVTSTFRKDNGIYCRRFLHTLTGHHAVAGHYPALACRDPERKRWVIGKF